MAIYKKNISNLFYIFVFAHLLIWTLVPSLTNHNLPLDIIEALAWGSNLDWGFNKHPPMSAFLPELIYQIFGPKDWAYYLLSQICIVVSFIVVFKLAEDFFDNKIYCLLSVLLLEGIYFYNFTTPEFNVNVCLIPFWSLSVFYLWRGIKNNKILDWLLLGLFAGLGFLSKYLFVYLGLAIDVLLIYMIYTKKLNFKCLVSFVPFIIILFPHIIWLTENDYLTITYGLLRTGSEEASIFNHIKHPIIFLGKQIGILLPFLLMVFILVKKFKVNINLNDDNLLFLLSINLIPIFFIFLTSFTMGVKIRTMWMTPFYISFGLLFVYVFKSQINLEKIKVFASIFLILFPSIVFLTANSTIFPFFVLGISETFIIFDGICLGEAFILILFFILSIKFSSSSNLLSTTTNKIILISLSHVCPTTMDSLISLNFSTTE